MKSIKKGVLYVSGTPIGNLEDITIRTLSMLRNAKIIACEDTRRTRKLLTHYDIKPDKLISYHLHSKTGRKTQIINFLLGGEDVFLMSDAGMPGVSDPGSQLVSAAWEEGITISVLPGVSAVTSALAVSGFSDHGFVFWGFMDRSNKSVRKDIFLSQRGKETTVMFAPPQKVLATLREIEEFLGDCQVLIARELTKKFEELRRGKVSEHILYFLENEPRGEFTFVIKPETLDEDTTRDDFFLKDSLSKLKNAGLPAKEAVKALSVLREVPRNRVYRLQLELDGKVTE